MSEELPMDKDSMIHRCRERIANGKRVLIESHRERDEESAQMARMSIRKNERFLAKMLQAEERK